MASTFDKVVHGWIKNALTLTPPGGTDYSSVPVIRAEENGERPTVPYVTYKVTDWTESDFDTFEKSEVDEQNPTDEMYVDHSNRNRVSVSVNAYHPDGREILSRVSKGRKQWEIRRELENAKVSHLRTGTIRDLTYLGDTRFRRRFQADFTFLAWAAFRELRPKVLEISATGNVHFDTDEVN